MGGKIVLHAFQIVFGNIRDALRVSVGPILIAVVLLAILAALMGEAMPLAMLESGTMAMATGRDYFFVVVILVLVMFLFSWIAVSWHRFVLLEEYPGLLPKMANRPIAAYAGKTGLLALLMIVVAVPLAAVVGLVMTPLMSAPSTAGAFFGLFVTVVLGTVMSYFWFRVAVVLPGTALGKPLTIGQGWAATAIIKSAIFSAALILVLLNVGVTILLGPIMAGMPVVGTVINIIVNWATLMVGVSILTTLYGHVIEGRELAA